MPARDKAGAPTSSSSSDAYKRNPFSSRARLGHRRIRSRPRGSQPRRIRVGRLFNADLGMDGHDDRGLEVAATLAQGFETPHDQARSISPSSARNSSCESCYISLTATFSIGGGGPVLGSMPWRFGTTCELMYRSWPDCGFWMISLNATEASSCSTLPDEHHGVAVRRRLLNEVLARNAEPAQHSRVGIGTFSRRDLFDPLSPPSNIGNR